MDALSDVVSMEDLQKFVIPGYELHETENLTLWLGSMLQYYETLFNQNEIVYGICRSPFTPLNPLAKMLHEKLFERKYYDHLKNKNITIDIKFQYAWCLVRSKYPADIKKGILLFEELCRENRGQIRDYLYYLAVGNARLKEYSQALGYCRRFLEIEPMNLQVQELESLIKTSMDREGAIGIAITAGFAVAIGAIVALGVALTKRRG